MRQMGLQTQAAQTYHGINCSNRVISLLPIRHFVRHDNHHGSGITRHVIDDNDESEDVSEDSDISDEDLEEESEAAEVLDNAVR